MFKPVPKGSVQEIEVVGFTYKCQLPPVGYGINRITKRLQHIGVRSASTKKKEQKWKPLQLPSDWNQRRKLEISRQQVEADYVDNELEKIRAKWWLHRLCGEWVLINGKNVYIPPSYWFYLNCCHIDIGLPKYRDTDRRFFYVWEYCLEDPNCAGLVDIERRRMGKTYKAGSILLDRASIHEKHHAGIQSKTSADAKGVFLKSVVTFFKKMPDFFRPVYDQSKGVTPSSELRFFQTTVKGKKAEKVLEGDELESWIDWGSSENYHYDGSKLQTYVMDEYGKPQEENVKDRWDIVKFCLDVDGSWVGKALLTSTIEDMKSGIGENPARQIWMDSNPSERDPNGRTKSGLYWFFLPAFETTSFDEFGMPEVEKAKVYYLNQRSALANDQRSLSSLKRKYPFSIEEAFMIDADNCYYNPELLNNRLADLWQDNLVTRGNFIWENGIQDSRVTFEKSKTGRWEVLWLFPDKESSNRVSKTGNEFAPENTLRFVIGSDPFSHNKTVDNRRSDGAALVLMRFDATSGNQYNNAFVCKYKARPESASIFYEDMIKMAVYYGCQILFENNKNNWDIYFKQRGYEKFLMKLDGYPDYGIPGNENTHRQLVEVTEEYINKNIHNVFFKDLIEQWLEFDMAKTTKYDVAMAAGYTLIADLRKMYKRQEGNSRPITDYIRKYKRA